MAARLVLSRNLRRYRLERDLSLGALSRRAGLAKQTIVAIEAGTSNPTVETLERLAEALDVGVRALLSELGTEILLQTAEDSRWQQHPGAEVRQLDHSFGSGYVVNAVLRLKVDEPSFQSPARGRGALRHCYVLDGTVQLGPTSTPITAHAGAFVRFPADTEHFFRALSPQATVFVNTTAPQLSMSGGTKAF